MAAYATAGRLRMHDTDVSRIPAIGAYLGTGTCTTFVWSASRPQPAVAPRPTCVIAPVRPVGRTPAAAGRGRCLVVPSAVNKT
ncbi:hypothetical protein FRAAL4490 [Frankia alni ACN14a]|uniref:Uncharacterized protein n=1 Tax=Frankia alni (strain DSM 45986 / CECT 9034 / ACN14a) TaxID=326424 RepID=Q0RH99_FRAAA|nr:hypothetical protein FRAAL4490 [Frankia alni ACN14a]